MEISLKRNGRKMSTLSLPTKAHYLFVRLIISNINIPDIEYIQGAQITYQGQRLQNKPITTQVDARGRQVFWIGLTGESVVDPKKSLIDIQSDFFALANGYVSITPIQIDATNYSILETLKDQISENSADVERML